MNEKVNILKRSNDVIIERIDASSNIVKRRNVSKSSLRIALESDQSLVGIYTFNEKLHLTQITNVMVDGVQLTLSNYDSLTDGLIESAGGAGGGGIGGDPTAAIATHNASPTAHPAIRALIDNLEFVKDVQYNSTTGDVTFTYRDNSTLTVNLLIAGMIQDLDYDPVTAELVITKADNSEVRVPLSDLIDVYTGFNGTHIQITVTPGNVIQAVLKAGTVTETELSAALMAKINGKADASDIPTKTSDLTNDSGFITSSSLPTVNNGVLTIKKNASDAGQTFTANQAGNTTVDLGLGTMAAAAASDYRTASAQNDIDSTHLKKIDIEAGTNVTITQPPGTNKVVVNVPGVPIPDKFSSTENGTGAVGASNTYNATLLTKISGAGTLDADDVVIFANGYQGQVVSVSGSTFVAITIQQPQQATWGTIGGTLANQSDLATELAKKYEKPSTGIPSTDMTSAVQTSLGKADSALQSFTETDPTVPAWAKQSTKPSYTASEVGAATAAQGAKADTALQAAALEAYYTIIETDGKFALLSHSHALLDFMDIDTAKTSLNAMAITKHLTHVSANTNQSFTVASVSANNVAFMIVFTATGAVTVAIPTTGDYINMGDASYTLANGDIIEIHGIFSTETNKYHIKVLTK